MNMKKRMQKRLMKNLERKSFDELSETEKKCLYLRDHPEALTEKLMAHASAYFLNYAYIRLKIREIYPELLYEYLTNNNIVRTPSHYEE